VPGIQQKLADAISKLGIHNRILLFLRLSVSRLPIV
jgi:hypothetical protein